MASGSIQLGKMVYLLSSRAQRKYLGSVQDYVARTLDANEKKIKGLLAEPPAGYVLVDDEHTSKHDPKPHYTVDVYSKGSNGIDKPIGCVHVYTDKTAAVWATPRAKAQQAYADKLTAQGLPTPS